MSDPSLYRLERPEEQTLPVVVDVPHAGDWIPDDVRDQMVAGSDELRRDLDLYVDRLWKSAPDLGATLLVSNVSRYVVDLNRAEDDVSPKTVRGGKRVDKDGYYQDRGVVWHQTTAREPVLDEPLSKKEFKSRLEEYYHPYHEVLEQEVERIRSEFGFCVLIDGHSMPSTGRKGHKDPGAKRAEIVPGDVEGESCDRTVRWMVEEHFRDAGFSVRSNEPYRGGWITRKFGRPDEGLHSIQIEVRRDLYMNERTFGLRRDGIDELEEVCSALLPRCDEFDEKALRPTRGTRY